jgi:hypothetical protein
MNGLRPSISIDHEFACLDAMRVARSNFLNDVIEHAERHQKELRDAGISAGALETDVLRSENTFQIAEFYYLIDYFHLSEPERISAYIDRHNTDMRALLNDKVVMRQQGLLPQRVKEAIFSDEQRAKVSENAATGRLRLDQSDIGRLLSPIMSPETCRKTIVALANGGLLVRRNIGQVLVISTGVLEGYYRNHLRHIAMAISAREA